MISMIGRCEIGDPFTCQRIQRMNAAGAVARQPFGLAGEVGEHDTARRVSQNLAIWSRLE